ncbi:MAG: SHOCT domain-containing protein [Propionicimonas sp.]
MGLMRMAARTAVVAGTATAVSGRVAHRQAGKYDAQQQEAYDAQQLAAYQQQEAINQAAAQQAAAPQPVYQQPPAPVEDEMTAKLRQLADLHAAGILSDEEFASAKAKALGI